MKSYAHRKGVGYSCTHYGSIYFILTAIILTFSSFAKFRQRPDLPQAKQNFLSSKRIFIQKWRHKLPNELRLGILGNLKILINQKSKWNKQTYSTAIQQTLQQPSNPKTHIIWCFNQLQQSINRINNTQQATTSTPPTKPQLQRRLTSPHFQENINWWRRHIK